MLIGALLSLASRSITAKEALYSINFEVIAFLFFMFIIGSALEISGSIESISYQLFNKAKSVEILVLMILFIMGFLAAFLMNDTIAIIGTPLMLILSRNHKIKAQLLLFSLAFAVTIGSTLSPIGNPQNLLIAEEATIKNPFYVFAKYNSIPMILNSVSAFLILRLFFKGEFTKRDLLHDNVPISDATLAKLSLASISILVASIILKLLFVNTKPHFEIPMTYIAAVSAFPIIAFSRRRLEIISKVDWKVLFLFASMFVLMRSVWDGGAIQYLMRVASLDKITVPAILTSGTIASQFISNVPFVALILPLLKNSSASLRLFMALASGSTIAGNLSILGAASNIIIVQRADKENQKMSFNEFTKIGLPLTILNILVYYIFLK